MARFNEFPEVEIPAFLEGPDWQDSSNDSHDSPCIVSSGYNAQGDLIIIWVNHEDPLERRVPASSRPRFYCEIEDINFRDFEQWGTDDPAEAARLIEETLAKFRKGEK